MNNINFHIKSTQKKRSTGINFVKVCFHSLTEMLYCCNSTDYLCLADFDTNDAYI